MQGQTEIPLSLAKGYFEKFESGLDPGEMIGGEITGDGIHLIGNIETYNKDTGWGKIIFKHPLSGTILLSLGIKLEEIIFDNIA